MAVRNIKLTIAYDGTKYHGWQIQPERRTIQGELTRAISELIGWKVRICGASRTDAGVSALGQVGLIQIDSPIPTERLAGAINDRLPAEIAVCEAVEVPMGFDVIGAVKSKLYRYTIYTGRVPPVLHIRHCWHLPAKLDTAAMSDAAQMLVGEKDFKSFASAADKRENSVRTIFRCNVTSSCVMRDAYFEKGKMDSCPFDTLPSLSARFAQDRFRRNDNTQYDIRNTRYENDWVYIEVQGNSFLYNMVRNIVGALVEVGTGRWRPEKMNDVLAARDRTAAGPIAPAAGLCLMRIEYA
jgi:tRNA pseudouridine38-40 synthase